MFTNTALLLLEVKLLVYGEKRKKPKLICLQYICKFIFNDSSLLAWNFSNFFHMVPNKIIMEILKLLVKPTSLSRRSEATAQCSWKRRKLLCIEVAYRNLAVHISLNPIRRSFQWQLRRLNWTSLFEKSTNQPLFPALFFPLNKRNTFDYSCWSVRVRKWSQDRKWSRTANDPQIGPQMIPDRKWSPTRTANDPD